MKDVHKKMRYAQLRLEAARIIEDEEDIFYWTRIVSQYADHGNGHSDPVVRGDTKEGLSDVRMRMLQVEELLQIQGVPKDYQMKGKQIEKQGAVVFKDETHTVKRLAKTELLPSSGVDLRIKLALGFLLPTPLYWVLVATMPGISPMAALGIVLLIWLLSVGLGSLGLNYLQNGDVKSKPGPQGGGSGRSTLLRRPRA